MYRVHAVRCLFAVTVEAIASVAVAFCFRFSASAFCSTYSAAVWNTYVGHFWIFYPFILPFMCVEIHT